MQPSFLTTLDLSNRWNISKHTLSQWRWSGQGPRFLKIGRRILYRVQDIENFEQHKECFNTSILPPLASNADESFASEKFKKRGY